MKTFKNIPKKIKIGPQTYDIVFSEIDDAQDGWIRWGSGKIILGNSLSESQAEQVLIHEILHGICFVTEFSKHLPEDEKEREEAVIERLDSLLYQVLKENNLYFGDKK